MTDYLGNLSFNSSTYVLTEFTPADDALPAPLRRQKAGACASSASSRRAPSA